MAGPEISGVAINARQGESDVSTITWIDNLHRSMEHVGRVIVDMIPNIYDTERTIRIVGKDQKSTEWVTVNQTEGVDPATGQPMIKNDITATRYDVRIETGPASKTQRQESAQLMLQMAQAMPQTFSAVADLIVQNMDFKDSDEAAERLKSMLGHTGQPPPPDPLAELEMEKKVEDLRGKKLSNAQKEIDIAEDVPPLAPQAVQSAAQAVRGPQGGQQ
jgi:hypothetical protein